MPRNPQGIRAPAAVVLASAAALVIGAPIHRALAEEQAIECSLVQLIATPERFDGKLVHTRGVATIEFENTGIYLSSESAGHYAKLNGLGLAIGFEDRPKYAALDRKWVVVAGRFKAGEPVRAGWRGYIEEITTLYSPDDVRVETGSAQ